MERYIELIEPFDQNGNVPNSVMATSPNGDWVLYSEAQAEIDALKAQNAELISAFSEVLRISDRQHDAWDAAKAAIAKARGESV